MKRIVILGGGGVFGVHLARYLLACDSTERVVCVGRNPVKSSAFTLDVGAGDQRYRYEQIHITYEPRRLFELFDWERPDTIVNFAAQAHGPSSWKQSWRYYETNCEALAYICEYLSLVDYLKGFIQIGTSELYGSVESPASEDAPMNPSSPYAVSKLAFDMHLATLKGFPYNIIRPSNAYGPGQAMHRVIPRAVICALTGQRMLLDGGGVARKSYIHAYDLAQAIYLVGCGAPPGRIYNVGPKNPISIRALVDAIARQANLSLSELCEIGPERKGEDSQYWLDSSLIRADLGWEPTISLEKGIPDMFTWGIKYLDVLKNEPSSFTLRA